MTNEKMPKVLYFGSFNPDYARNRVLIDGLRINGVEVIECRDDAGGFRRYFNLFKEYRQLKKDYDVMIVGFLGQTIVPFAKLICRKKIIFDAFVSLYEANVWDRKIVRPGTIKSFYYWFLDWLSFRLADIVLFDTNEHIKYATQEFKIRPDKFRRIFVGAEEKIFKPAKTNPENSGNFRITFYGSYIPLQGVSVILKSAKLLEGEAISFNIIGDGQEKPKMLALAKDLKLNNVNFIGRLSLEDLSAEMSAADVCLGIFGDTPKTRRVIPNKIFGAAAMAKPAITADTPAMRELFGEEDLFLIKPCPEALAQAILELKNNPEKRGKLASNARLKFEQRATAKKLGEELKQIILNLIRK